MSNGPLENPYAPPAAPALAPSEVREGSEGGASSFEGERRSVGIAVLLTIVTLGLSPSIWFVLRCPFLDRLAARQKMGLGFRADGAALGRIAGGGVLLRNLVFAIQNERGGGNAGAASFLG